MHKTCKVGVLHWIQDVSEGRKQGVTGMLGEGTYYIQTHIWYGGSCSTGSTGSGASKGLESLFINQFRSTVTTQQRDAGVLRTISPPLTLGYRSGLFG